MRIPIRGQLETFDVDLAKELITAKPRFIRPVRLHYGMLALYEWTCVIDLLDAEACSKVWHLTQPADINVPIIVGRQPRVLIIDGYHRAAKAWLMGLRQLPACWLTKRELKRCSM